MCYIKPRCVKGGNSNIQSATQTKKTFLQSLKGLLDTALLNSSSKDSRLVYLYYRIPRAQTPPLPARFDFGQQTLSSAVSQNPYELLGLWKLLVAIMLNKVPFSHSLGRRKGQVPAALFAASFAYWVRLLNSLISTICWEPANNALHQVTGDMKNHKDRPATCFQASYGSESTGLTVQQPCSSMTSCNSEHFTSSALTKVHKAATGL